jgi:flagellar basal-body rod protein FlgB
MSTSDRLLFDRTLLPLAGRGLDAYALRQKAIANNVANTETDGYVRRTVSFEAELKEALGTDDSGILRTHPNHLPDPDQLGDAAPKVELDESMDYYNGHNNVDVDREMTELSRALLSFGYTSKLVRGTFDTLQFAIRGTR